jgi:hypothetical protein
MQGASAKACPIRAALAGVSNLMISLDRNHIGTLPGEHCSSNRPSLLLYFLHLDNKQPTFRS